MITNEFNTLAFVEPVAHQEDTSKRLAHINNAYPKQFPQHIAGRRRLMQSGTLAAPVGLAPTITTFQVWTKIRQNPEIARVLKFFKVIRTDIRMTLVIRASPSMYGAYMVGYQYGPTDVSIQSLVTSNAVIGDISTSEAIDIVIPYKNTHNFLTTYPLVGEGSDQIYCELILANLYTDNITGGTNSLDYDLYFALENVDGAMPTSDSEVFPQSGSSIYQDMLASREEHRRGQELSMYEKGLNHATFPYANTAALGAVAAGMSMKAGYDRLFGRSTQTENVIQDMNEEEVPKNQNGGKAKNVRQSFYGDLATLHGQDMPTLSEELVPSSIYTPTEMGMGTDVGVSEIGNLPGLHAITSFASTDVPGTTKNLNFIMGGNRNTVTGRQPFTYGSFISRYARYYRCDHKVALHFHTSPLVAARFRVDIQYMRTPSTEGELIGDQSYEVPSEVFLIKGSQIKTFTIPFMSTHSVIPLGTTFAYMNVTLMTPPSTASAVATNVYMMVTTSHPNLSIYSLQSGHSTEVEPQSGIRQVHEAVTESNFEAKSAMVPVGMPAIASLKAIISRFDTSQGPLASLDSLPPVTLRTDYNLAPNILSVTMLFAFISGSIENKVTYTSLATGTKNARLGNFTEPSQANGRVGDGESITILPAWPILDFRTPYRGSVPMVWRKADSRMQAPNIADVEYDITDISVVYVRAGRDFAMHHLNFIPGSGWCKPFFIG